MPYTIVRLADKPDLADEEDDARLVSVELLKQGVSLERVPRVRPEGRQNGWLYVWQSRDDAAGAAEQLARRTGGRWEVRPTDAEPSLGPLRWIEIDANLESDGWVFALDTITRMMVRQRFPGSCRHRSVCVSVEPDDDLLADAEHFGALARQVLFLLTWLPAEELAVFGRFVVIDRRGPRVLLPETAIEGSREGSGFRVQGSGR
ncbi:MAG TPA: hypothetical protein VNH11_29215 [Pirellulales bacterium]|nr:hypothetical protein [Pirellulales bacterium]